MYILLDVGKSLKSGDQAYYINGRAVLRGESSDPDPTCIHSKDYWVTLHIGNGTRVRYNYWRRLLCNPAGDY